MLPVVVAATQWGIVPGFVAAVAGAAAADFFLLSAALQLLDPRSAGHRRSAAVPAGRAGHQQSRRAPQERSGRVAPSRKGDQRAACLLAGPRHLPHQPRSDIRSARLSFEHAALSRRPDRDGAGRSMALEPTIRGSGGDPAREAAKLIAAGAVQCVERHARSCWNRNRRGLAGAVISPEILGYGAIAVELGESAGRAYEAPSRNASKRCSKRRC
jgi:hypothetical protein